MKIIKNNEIKNALKKNDKIYLSGNLSLPNVIEHFENNLEIGIAVYDKYKAEKAHVHNVNDEYNFILNGELKLLMIDTNEEFIFKKGDIFLLNKGERHVTKCNKGTKVLFIKTPGGNDKELIEDNDIIDKFSEKW